ncbi:MAG: phosphoesterase [Candidatus Eremiobacter antarcticus]|nr:phosphoesterase [Candidatus Eremiobacteraeota bacterium]PZR60873.1 MAG: phosphoesterase [Candidatus Eremiobacter sp. RRmetagenome_bin22]
MRKARLVLLSAAVVITVACLPARAQPAADGRTVLIANLRAHIKHIFVIYQENRSFDSYFGTFPGADNLATAEARAHGFRQYDPIGNQWISPFRISDADLADADHSRPALYTKADGGRMDLFVAAEEGRMLRMGATLQDAQAVGVLTMAYQDCDTVPFLWKYAKTFALYDHIFQGMYGPSTPGNIDLVAAQTGLTQWARHPESVVNEGATGPGEPVVDDLYPAFGPYHNGEPKTKQLDQTYASLLLTLSGASATAAAADNDDIREDIAELARLGHPAIPWGWYQEGFKDDGSGTYPAYVTHHNVPQFFGYVRRNEPLWSGVHDLTDLVPAIQAGKLGDRSVVFVKGGYRNPFGWLPANSDPRVRKSFLGDDDHPGYSDSHISEAMVATVVNAVARSSYWNDSAIIIVWDDSEGYYDHVPPPVFETCPDGRPCGDGPRVPLILISPFARSGAIVSDAGDHASFSKFLGALFDLPALASLPDEKPYLPRGPRDTNPALTDLLGGFDAERLAGVSPPLPAAAAQVPDDVIGSFPPPMSCGTLGITPDVVPGGMGSPPQAFTPRTSRSY